MRIDELSTALHGVHYTQPAESWAGCRAFLFGLLEDITKRMDLQERNRCATPSEELLQVACDPGANLHSHSCLECNNQILAFRVVTCLRQWVPKLKGAGFSEIVFEDALDMLTDQLNSLGQQDSLTLAVLESNMRDDTVIDLAALTRSQWLLPIRRLEGLVKY